MYKKLKSLLADDLVFTSLLLCCVAIAAFLLGRASLQGTPLSGPVGSLISPTVRQTALVPVASLEASSTAVSRAATPPLPVGGNTGPIVVSKSGTKYHLTTCPGAKQIKDENKIYFESATAAAAAGYSPAANCPGL
jgi:hypothetical protein